MAHKLTAAEETFVKRMAHHVENGLSFEDAARAVLDDDARIFEAFCDRGHAEYFPTADERGVSVSTGARKGDVIASEVTRTVYNRLRAA